MQAKELVMKMEILGEKANAFGQDKDANTDELLNEDIGLREVEDDEEDRVLSEQADASKIVSTSESLDVDEEKTVKPTETIDPKKTETNDGEAYGKMIEEKVVTKAREAVSEEQSEHGQEKRSGVNVENEKPPSKVNRDVVFGQERQNPLLAKHNKQVRESKVPEKGSERVPGSGIESDEVAEQEPLVAGVEVDRKKPGASHEADKRLSDDKTTSDKSEQGTEPKVLKEGSERVHGQHGYSPSICGMSLEAVQKVCNTEVKICKYKTEQTSGDEPFHITTTLQPNQGDCIRRCDKRYGLSQAHCSKGETCFTGLTACTKCALLTRRGCEAF